jgi:hypothetical protein
LLVLVCLAVSASACGRNDPVKPVNHNPVIRSATVFPSTIGLNDSAIVVCDASDPDADSLVYDWITDDRIRLKGARPGDPFLHNTSFNAEVIYAQIVSAPTDTAWVECKVRDRRGGADSRTLQIILHQ